MVEGAGDHAGDGQGGCRAVGVAFVEVVAVGGHGVGDVSQADDIAAGRGGVGLQGGGFHLNAVDLGAGGVGDRGGGFPVGGVGGPGHPGQDRLGGAGQHRTCQMGCEVRGEVLQVAGGW